MPIPEYPHVARRIIALAETVQTPFYVYDEALIRQNVRELNAAFSWSPGFREYFAVKATPNPAILRLLVEEKAGADCASIPELVLARRVGLKDDGVFFSSNTTKMEEFAAARDLGAIINVDSPDLIPRLLQASGPPKQVSIRYNPGALLEGNSIIGKPLESKFGCTREQVVEGVRMLQEAGVTEIGLHIMVASNERNVEAFRQTARMMFHLAIDVHRATRVRCRFINLGGGIGIPYRPDDVKLTFGQVGAAVKECYEELLKGTALDPLRICLENGRALTGPCGWLVTRVVSLKKTYKTYVGVDACMANLMRPGMYGAYHHITLAGKDDLAADCVCDVVGPLCENNDKFGVDRTLPAPAIGDLAIIHDAGAHGSAMGFQYNGRLRAAEYLLREQDVKLIRRAETIEDYFNTTVWD